MQHLLTGLPTILWASEGNDPSQTQSRPALRWASREPSDRTLNKTPLPPQPPLQRGTLHSSPTGLLTRHTFSSQGLHTYLLCRNAFSLVSDQHMPPISHRSPNEHHFYHRALFWSSDLNQHSLHSPSSYPAWFFFIALISTWLIIWVTEVKVSSMRPEFVSFTALLSSTRKVPYTW